MDDKPRFAEERIVPHYRRRTLDASFAPLKAYLHPGMSVLDVGCGPGTITVGVARVVHPGSVVGVDIAGAVLDQARALAEQEGVDNVRFQAGDAYHLDFADGTFDVTFSHALIVHVREPLRALIEQQRVTKKGGWVVATIGDYGQSVLYPPCPAFQAWWQALQRLDDPSLDHYSNLFRGRESLALFAEAGFADIRLQGLIDGVDDLYYAGSDNFEDGYGFVKRTLDLEKGLAGRLVELGAIDAETVRAAQREWEAWHRHPHALSMTGQVCAAGRAP